MELLNAAIDFNKAIRGTPSPQKKHMKGANNSFHTLQCTAKPLQWYILQAKPGVGVTIKGQIVFYTIHYVVYYNDFLGRVYGIKKQ